MVYMADDIFRCYYGICLEQMSNVRVDLRQVGIVPLLLPICVGRVVRRSHGRGSEERRGEH